MRELVITGLVLFAMVCILWLLFRFVRFFLRILLSPFRWFRKARNLPSISSGNGSGTPKRLRKSRNTQTALPSIGFHWPSSGRFDYEVVGESFHQEAIHTVVNLNQQNGGLYTRAVATLTPENDNEFDDKSVAIRINNLLVGHMSSEDARSFRRRLSLEGLAGQITICDAQIVAHERSKLAQGGTFYSVWLDLKPFRPR
jgi:hypothetical protein